MSYQTVGARYSRWFEGAIGLAGEVAAKKISSEEETYSDESILIYVNNFIGIEQTVLPFMSLIAAADQSAADMLGAAFVGVRASVAAFVGPGSRRLHPCAVAFLASFERCYDGIRRLWWQRCSPNATPHVLTCESIVCDRISLTQISHRGAESC